MFSLLSSLRLAFSILTPESLASGINQLCSGNAAVLTESSKIQIGVVKKRHLLIFMKDRGYWERSGRGGCLTPGVWNQCLGRGGLSRTATPAEAEALCASQCGHTDHSPPGRHSGQITFSSDLIIFSHLHQTSSGVSKCRVSEWYSQRHIHSQWKRSFSLFLTTVFINEVRCRPTFFPWNVFGSCHYSACVCNSVIYWVNWEDFSVDIYQEKGFPERLFFISYS